jgi:hypothetical protein
MWRIDYASLANIEKEVNPSNNPTIPFQLK